MSMRLEMNVRRVQKRAENNKTRKVAPPLREVNEPIPSHTPRSILLEVNPSGSENENLQQNNEGVPPTDPPR
ncbi:hypothetical protein C2E23DRAFT_850218 [Lenzites betulinus]|nr:hypothetical protein C2E23DRAFT_850218 [Lenzites betulinus]